MTPQNIAGLTVPEKELKELIDALAQMRGPAPVVVLHPPTHEKAA